MQRAPPAKATVGLAKRVNAETVLSVSEYSPTTGVWWQPTALGWGISDDLFCYWRRCRDDVCFDYASGRHLHCCDETRGRPTTLAGRQLATLLLAKLVGPTGRVLAFEPTDYAFAKQQKNLSLNPDLTGRVTSYHCFLSAEDDSDVPTDIYSAWPLTGGERLHTKHLGQPMPTIAARSRKLDTILREAGVDRVQLVKLDVDGFEVDVLRGAPELLKTKPVFVMELAPYCLDEHGSSLDEMLSFFRENGYSIHTEAGRPLPQSSGELLKIIGDGSSLNVVAS